jgi:hypothetical protein
MENKNCNDIEELIILNVSDAISEEQKKILNEHLQKCEDCVRLLSVHYNLKTIEDNLAKMPESITDFVKLKIQKSKKYMDLLKTIEFSINTSFKWIRTGCENIKERLPDFINILNTEFIDFELKPAFLMRSKNKEPSLSGTIVTDVCEQFDEMNSILFSKKFRNFKVIIEITKVKSLVDLKIRTYKLRKNYDYTVQPEGEFNAVVERNGNTIASLSLKNGEEEMLSQEKGIYKITFNRKNEKAGEIIFEVK